VNPILWLADPQHAAAAFWVLAAVGVRFLADLVRLALLLRRGAGVVGRVAGPWLRSAAWSYLSRSRDVEPVHCCHQTAQHLDADLPTAPESLLLDLAPDEVGDDLSFDPEPGPVTVSETFGPASFGWFDCSPLPHRVAPLRPAEVAQDIEQVLTLANRFTRDAAAAADGGVEP
jgi:hypothetical protein